MISTPAHRVIFFALDAEGRHLWDSDDCAVVDRVVDCADLAEAQRLHRAAVIEAGSLAAANLSVAVEAFAADDLAGYLHALNTDARLAAEMPQDGTWIPGLTEDPDHWAETGVTTPADLAAYLDGCFEREMEKKAMAG